MQFLRRVAILVAGCKRTMPSRRLADLLREQPDTWGLRGDPFLWDELADKPWPADEPSFQVLLERTCKQLTGVPLSGDEPVYVKHFAHGGMSSGYLSPSFWRDTAFPLLLSRFRRAHSRS